MLESENNRVKELAESEKINEKLQADIKELTEKISKVEKNRIESEGMLKTV